MPVDDEKLFEARLAKFGLHRDEINAEVLVVAEQQNVRLHVAGGGITRPRILQPSNVSQLKEWVGVPQSIVSKNAHAFAKRQTATTLPSDLNRLSTEVLHHRGRSDPRLREHSSAMRETIRQYLYGDARRLANLEPLIGRNVGVEFPFWFFRRVQVDKSGVLEFGSGINSLVTDTLIIKRGGEIRSTGNLTIHCRRIARS
jgi:hypothetical protein